MAADRYAPRREDRFSFGAFWVVGTVERGVAFVNGAPYGGGILAKGPDAQPPEPSRIEEIAALVAVAVPDDLWAELDALAPAPDCWLH